MGSLNKYTIKRSRDVSPHKDPFSVKYCRVISFGCFCIVVPACGLNLIITGNGSMTHSEGWEP
jgi:hypothetical protein